MHLEFLPKCATWGETLVALWLPKVCGKDRPVECKTLGSLHRKETYFWTATSSCKQTPHDIHAYGVNKPRSLISSLRLASSARKGLTKLHGEPHPGLYERLVSRDGVTLRDGLLDMGR